MPEWIDERRGEMRWKPNRWKTSFCCIKLRRCQRQCVRGCSEQSVDIGENGKRRVNAGSHLDRREEEMLKELTEREKVGWGRGG